MVCGAWSLNGSSLTNSFHPINQSMPSTGCWSTTRTTGTWPTSAEDREPRGFHGRAKQLKTMTCNHCPNKELKGAVFSHPRFEPVLHLLVNPTLGLFLISLVGFYGLLPSLWSLHREYLLGWAVGAWRIHRLKFGQWPGILQIPLEALGCSESCLVPLVLKVQKKTSESTFFRRRE
jgi:hypothetical protein